MTWVDKFIARHDDMQIGFRACLLRAMIEQERPSLKESIKDFDKNQLETLWKAIQCERYAGVV